VLCFNVLYPALHDLNDLSALGQENRKTLTDVVDSGEVLKLSAYLVVVAALCVLESLEMSVERVLGRECSTVDTGEHLVLLASAPVSAGHGRELERLDRRSGHQVRTCAQVREVALLVEGDGFALACVFLAEFNLVGFALFFEVLYSFVGSHCEVFEAYGLLNDLLHFCFDFCQGVGGEGLLGVEIIVEAVLDSRAYGELCRREKALYCLSQNVGGGVVECSLSLLVLKCEELNGAAVGEGGAEVAYLAVDFRCTCSLSLSEFSCRIECGQRSVKLLDLAVS